MAKNLDGIKKLNPEEIKKNRKIVLSYIGEKDKDAELTKEPKTVSRIVSVFNKVDGIKLNKIFSAKPKINNLALKPAPARDNRISNQEKIAREELAEKERAKQIKIEREEFVKKEIAEEARKWQEKLRLEEKAREEKRIIKENARLEKIKRAEEIERIKQEAKLAKLEAARKRKLKRQKAIKLFRENLNNRLGAIFSAVKRNFVYGMLYLITFLIIGYLVFCLLVLRFKISDNIVGEIVRILPVPAAVSSQGIVNYYDFRGIRNNNNYTNLSLAEKKDILAKWIIYKNLSNKYNLPVDSSGEALAIAFVADKDFNQVGLSRIKKISELLKNVDSLEPLSKYADEYGGVVYYDSEAAIEKFGPAVFNLKINQISDIIFSGNGYYITQIADNKNGQLGVKYLFIGAKTLNQHVNEELAEIKIFILAN